MRRIGIRVVMKNTLVRCGRGGDEIIIMIFMTQSQKLEQFAEKILVNSRGSITNSLRSSGEIGNEIRKRDPENRYRRAEREEGLHMTALGGRESLLGLQLPQLPHSNSWQHQKDQPWKI